jgi:16S rRNA C967 or C1407 C5-methylase (RsmB/RsmF family)/NOL1/NOP2/fmu family ribosome biogenesis protein
MPFPEGFIKHIENCEGFNESSFSKAHAMATPVSIRFNSLKPINHHHQEKVPWCDNAFYLDHRPAFVFDPLFHAGVYYVQEASSMFTGYLFQQYAPTQNAIKVLDLCAAPGGKSTLIADLMNENSLLVSNEVIKTRSKILKENIDKWGAPNIVVSNNDPREFKNLTQYFDVIIIDAPCSGSGLFRKDPAAMKEWSLDNVTHCSLRQGRIITDIIPTLKPGGLLIYATCSYSTEEDESIIESLLHKGFTNPVNSSLPAAFGEIIRNKYGYRFYPDKIKGEGFFISILQSAASENVPTSYQPKRYEAITIEEKDIIIKYFDKPDKLFFYKHKEVIYCIPENLKNDIQALGSLYLVKSGTAVGIIKNSDLIPDHELAMSVLISKEIPRIEVDEKTAVEYLRKNTIVIDAQIKGWCLITYLNIPLGWAKIIPGRLNNYYPIELRIRK